MGEFEAATSIVFYGTFEPVNKDEAQPPFTFTEVLDMARALWAGLDVGTETTSICVIDDDGTVLREGLCPTTVKDVHRKLAFLKRRRSARIALETGVGSHLARGLRTLGYSVDIYEARQLSKFLRVRRNKTDAGDANGIAEAGRVGASVVNKVYLKSLECQSLASRLTIRRHLIRSRVRAASLLCRQLELFGGRIRQVRRGRDLRSKAEAQIKALFGSSQSALSEQFRGLLDHCELLSARQDAIDTELRQLAAGNEVCRRLMGVPGVGPICALTFYAAVEEPTRFRHNAAIGCYFGLTPRLHQSGMTSRMGRISKMGNRAVRSLLVQASGKFMQHTPKELELRAWASAIEQRRGRGRARIALARKLAIIMLAMWKSGRDYEPRLLAPA